jgi:hypothetical protein
LRWGIDSSNHYSIWVNGPILELGGRFDGVLDIVEVNYSATAHRFVRLRHDPGLDAVLFETRAANAAWQERRRMRVMLGLSAMTIDLVGGTYEPVAEPGLVRFDNLRSCPP